MKFDEQKIETFMGGKFMPEEGELKTSEGLLKFFEQCVAEVKSWGDDDLEIAEVFFDRDHINVTLKDGIVQ